MVEPIIDVTKSQVPYVRPVEKRLITSCFDIDQHVGDEIVEVLSTNGDTHLGGDDFDEVLINYVADEFQKSNGVELRNDTMALQRLQEACEKAKKELKVPASTKKVSGPSNAADFTPW